MLDGNHTTVDWQQHSTDILVLPVGAFEQHSVHLPLATDTLQADFFGQMVAEALDAALLPAIPIATSMEHTGYRGSFSLRPETLMQIVRDVVDEATRQGFRILVVLNAHGGNHALVPVCRDINRRDSALKIILVNYWEHGELKVVGASPRPGLDIHANESETSIMLALRPDLVRPARADAQYASEERPLKQADLTTFGIGHISPSGAAGWPSGGNVEQGRALIEGIRHALIPHLRDRIERLRDQPRYAGPGGLTIRPLRLADIPAGVHLKSLAGWNQIDADWAMLLAAAPDGCFGMVHQGRVIGTVTTTTYGPFAWIGMVLVDPAFRGMGIATRLMHAALTHLQAVETVKLDATPAGRGVYAKLGFVPEYGLQRLTQAAVPAVTGDMDGVRPMEARDLETVREVDLATFGGDRGSILRTLWEAAPDLCRVLESGGRITGYAFGRPGATFSQLGPLVAETADDAQRLGRAVLKALRGRSALVDVPDAQPAFHAFLGSLGFGVQRAFTRMYRGANPQPGLVDRVYAAGGPEIG
ncbi:MAG: GNAT family N-acetyltransferase [Lentisphaerae bacterium]|nr:GNAT family N-acetyltransferase [Lentisphaerota bacterium]